MIFYIFFSNCLLLTCNIILCIFILYSEIMINFVISSISFCIFIGFHVNYCLYEQNHVICECIKFISSLPIFMPFFFLYFLLIVLEDLQKMSNKSGWSEHDYFVIDIHRKVFRLLSLSIMSDVSCREFAHII